MSLESCSTCGYALGISDGRCRHCHPSATTAAASKWFNLKLLVPLAPIAVLLGIFLYRTFVH